MKVKPWVDYDLYHQWVTCQICGELEVFGGQGPVQRFLAEVSAFSRCHEHGAMTPEGRHRQWALWANARSPGQSEP